MYNVLNTIDQQFLGLVFCIVPECNVLIIPRLPFLLAAEYERTVKTHRPRARSLYLFCFASEEPACTANPENEANISPIDTPSECRHLYYICMPFIIFQVNSI